MSDEPKERETPNDDAALPPDSTQGTPAESSDHWTPTREDDALVTPANDAYASSSDPYGHIEASPVEAIPPEAKSQEITGYLPPEAVAQIPPKAPPPPPPSTDEDEEEGDEEEKGMLRMSFMEHLEELRTRLLRSVIGLVVAFILSIGFCKDLWNIVSAPAIGALRHLGFPPYLAQISPMEQFNVMYLKLPLLVSVFVGSPWILYQVWAFISPGLYRREKKWAVPFILCTAGLFIAGGCFAYFVAFRYGLEFLLGIGRDVHVQPFVSINEYFNLFVNVTLGIGLVFEMPVIIFFLTLLRLASPRFLMRHSRYAILGITIIAAVVTPTPDAFNMMLFAVPMVLLYFVGLFASYLLVLRREGKKFPWGKIAIGVAVLLLVLAGVVVVLVHYNHFQLIPKWPFILPPGVSHHAK